MRNISNQTYYVASLLVVSLTANYTQYRINKVLSQDITAYQESLINVAKKLVVMNSQFK